MDHKIDRAAMSGVFNLVDIFELIDDGFDKSSFAQQEFIRHRHELILHVGSEVEGSERAIRRLVKPNQKSTGS